MDITINPGSVIICGPTSTGKTTLAKRIRTEMPWPECELVSHDEVLGIVQETVTSQEEINHFFKILCYELIAGAIKDGAPLIYEGKYVEVNRLCAFLAVQMELDPKRSICLIKMAPSLKIQQKYARLRSGPKPTPLDICRQNEVFRGVLNTRFEDERLPIREYVVTNPEDLVLHFQE